MTKIRADQLLLDLGLAETRSKARALIMAGQVFMADRPITKAGEQLAEDAELRLKDGMRYVSRGGFKLEGALEDLEVDPAGLRCVDVGASTGGFSDCLLQRGAVSVTAVDVGQGLIDWKLRNDDRVRVVERVNARNMTVDDVGGDYDLAVVDVSFISLALVLPAMREVVRPGGLVLAMVKPQFEVGRDQVGKGGVVRDTALIASAVENAAQAAEACGFERLRTAPSRVAGPKGNREQFLLLVRA